ncbi:MAG TPA: SDR family oxidoreductase [Acidimicrobiales bacterium]|nr:SDR family oxidoreductase [Acidimicrobiales bacterium]
MSRHQVPTGTPPEHHEAGVALVTGGASPLGRAAAAALEAAGHRVVVTWHRTPVDDRPAVRCDITDADAVAAAFAGVEAEHGPIDVLVANAGVGHLGPLVTTHPDDVRSVIDVSLVGAALCAAEAARRMRRRRYGRIVLVGSVAALHGPAGLSGYAAAKAGLIGLARSLAREVGSRGVTVNVVAPGLLEGSAVTGDDRSSSQATVEAWIADTPLRRLGTFAEAAAAIELLARPTASFVTGAVLPVDGGYAMGAT